MTVILYDSMIYKVGAKKDRYLNIYDEKSIDQLNILQMLNCYETVFFNHQCNENYIRQLFQQSLKFKKANVPHSRLTHLINKGEIFDPNKKKNLIILGTSDCETKLEIQGLKIHSGSKKINMNKHENMLRPLPRFLL